MPRGTFVESRLALGDALLPGLEGAVTLLDGRPHELDGSELGSTPRELGLLLVDPRLAFRQLPSEPDEVGLAQIEIAFTQTEEAFDRGLRVAQALLAPLEVLECLLDDRGLLGKLSAPLGEDLLEALFRAR